MILYGKHQFTYGVRACATLTKKCWRGAALLCLVWAAVASPAQDRPSPAGPPFKMPLKFGGAKGGRPFAPSVPVTKTNPRPGTGAASEVVLHSFTPNARGADPYANVIRDLAGNLYGTSAFGGPSGAGVVFKVDTAGHETVMYGFTGGSDGGYPEAALIRDLEGNLYGTANGGGASGAGTVFKVSASGQETVLYSFTGGSDGAYPEGDLIRDLQGNFYSTTSGGGTSGAGVVFKLSPSGQETVLYSFTGGTDGANPYAGLLRDLAGNLYGTTAYGGASGDGVVYELDLKNNETVLYSFTGGADGANPAAGVIRDAGGNLYGTTYYGGNLSGCYGSGCGVVYQISAGGLETVLYTFSGGTDGANPYAGVIRDLAGNLYGTAEYGGDLSECYGSGCGVVYKVGKAGETLLYTFTGAADGAYPSASLVSDLAGNLYGTSDGGGPAQAGVVFKLNKASQETVVYGFPGTDGSGPWAGVILDSAGNLYGTTNGGGASGAGTVYKIDTTGKETVLYNFTGGADGGDPNAGVILDAAGNLYGTAVDGGAYGGGVVYKLAPSGQQTVLYSFMDSTNCFGCPSTDGNFPYGGVIMDSAGNLYGTTASGGTSGWGTLWKLDTSGQETILHDFTNGADGGNVYSGVVMDSAGNLYGTTYAGAKAGVVYEMAASGEFSVLYSFMDGSDGGYPWAGVVLDAAGNLYGTTWSGGNPATDYPGVVYEVNPGTMQETVLYGFQGTTDGNTARGGVVLDSAGNVYGTTEGGGTGSCYIDGCGVVFVVTPAGQETVLYTFTGGTGGDIPEAGVTLDSTGNVYGTTVSGGAAGGGVVYKLPGAVIAP
jgi:uncharacterized repeat protein (TIGR03803 family)